jgi:hypothetical protein
MTTRTRRTALVLSAASAAMSVTAALTTGAAFAEPTPAPTRAPGTVSGTVSGTEPMCGEAAGGAYSCSLWTEHGTVTVTAASSCPPDRQPRSNLDIHGWAQDVVDCSTTAREAARAAAEPLGIVSNGLGE